MSIRAWDWACDQQVGSPIAKSVLVALAKFADERVVPLSGETYAAIERALFEPVDVAHYVAAGTHVPCADCDGEPGHRCMRCCGAGIVRSA